MEQQGQQCWWESEQAHQIAGGWTAEKQRRHDERHKQAGDRESDWKLLVKQLEQDGISFTRSSTTAAAAVQATNDEQGLRGGSEPETAEAVGSSWSNKADIKHEKKERRRRRVEERRGAAAETAGAAGTSGPAAEAVEAKLMQQRQRQQRTSQSRQHKQQQMQQMQRNQEWFQKRSCRHRMISRKERKRKTEGEDRRED